MIFNMFNKKGINALGFVVTALILVVVAFVVMNIFGEGAKRGELTIKELQCQADPCIDADDDGKVEIPDKCYLESYRNKPADECVCDKTDEHTFMLVGVDCMVETDTEDDKGNPAYKLIINELCKASLKDADKRGELCKRLNKMGCSLESDEYTIPCPETNKESDDMTKFSKAFDDNKDLFISKKCVQTNDAQPDNPSIFVRTKEADGEVLLSFCKTPKGSRECVDMYMKKCEEKWKTK